ncbi:MAG TPA: hypothetical protein VNX26_18675 [Candidatus Acidoferrum sp.]|jgi:uncharacterized delta-60 repeat protein|nr:hypothetical protein [Candidatus Acidoferrum sp.]
MKIVRSFVLPSLLAFSMVSAAIPANAAAGSLDPTFGKGGVAEAKVGFPVAAALQPDGKIVVLTLNDVVARFLSNGNLDTSFGNGGSVTLSFATSPVAMALQADGKIVLAGRINNNTENVFAVARLNANGSVDTGFGTGGTVTTDMGFPGTTEAVVIQPDGKILLGGTVLGTDETLPNEVALVRYNTDGSLDSTFGNSGGFANGPGEVEVVSVQGVTTVAILSDGDILVLNFAAGGGAIAQFSPTGSLRSTVTSGTIVAASKGENPVFQGDGSFIVSNGILVGTARNKDLDTQVARFTATGQLDPTFKTTVFDLIGEGGSSNSDFLNAVALQADGKVVLAGSHSHAFANASNALVRLNSNGSFDTSFGTNGIVTNKFPAGTNGLDLVLIQTDGKILALGTAGSNFTNLVLERYLAQ